jgi:hypothetical protein
MTNGPPGEAPNRKRCPTCAANLATASQLRELTKQRGDEIARLRTELDHALADAARYQAAFEACMGVKP